MKKWPLPLVAALAFVCLAPEAKAQQAQYRLVTACDASFGPVTAPNVFLTVDIHGTLCAGGGSGVAATIADGADVAEGAKADAAWVSGSGSVIAILKNIAGSVAGAIPAGTANIGSVGQISQYPTGAVPITISATGTTGATTATLAASALVKTYICGFSIRANATAAATANSTVTGTVTGTLNFTQWTAPLASGIGLTEQIFTPCIPSSAINTGIAVISAAPGSGGVVSVTAWGYQL